MKVREVMTRQPSCCTPDSTLQSAACLMASCDCGAIPVVSDLDRMPVGIITDRDIVVRAIAQGVGDQVLVRDVMTSPAITVTEEASLAECIEVMERAQIRRAIVVDARGRTTGIIAQADVARGASKRKAGELLQEVSQAAANGPSQIGA
jgi:CBS domain-containing protein